MVECWFGHVGPIFDYEHEHEHRFTEHDHDANFVPERNAIYGGTGRACIDRACIDRALNGVGDGVVDARLLRMSLTDSHREGSFQAAAVGDVSVAGGGLAPQFPLHFR